MRSFLLTSSLILLIVLQQVSADIAQVKYLGGITFLLKDRCPESASEAEINNYKQCAENEILHVSCAKKDINQTKI